MRLFISGSAPLLAGDVRRVPRAHRSRDPRALRNDRDRHDHVEPARRRARSAAPSARRCPASRSASSTPKERAARADESAASRCSGPNVFAGYWRMPDKTREEFTADGCFRTGDIGMLPMPNGYLRIVGRAKDLIISGGLNVYPKEIEEQIDALPGVDESAVIGVPDADFGEAVAAVVVARSGPRADRGGSDRGAKDEIASFKVPKRVHFVDGAAAQRDGQGAEEPAARAIRETAATRNSRAVRRAAALSARLATACRPRAHTARTRTPASAS